MPLSEALAFLPEMRLADADAASAASHGRAVAGHAPAGATVRLTDDAGLIALAEPNAAGDELKPVVGFRG